MTRITPKSLNNLSTKEQISRHSILPVNQMTSMPSRTSSQVEHWISRDTVTASSSSQTNCGINEIASLELPRHDTGHNLQDYNIPPLLFYRDCRHGVYSVDFICVVAIMLVRLRNYLPPLCLKTIQDTTQSLYRLPCHHHSQTANSHHGLVNSLPVGRLKATCSVVRLAKPFITAEHPGRWQKNVL